METIVALATPAGNSGVAVIRLSGEKSKDILKSIINENIDFKPRYMYLKKIYCDNIVDDALVVYFQAPNSYTGEDVVEIQSHGGYFLAQKIIEKCLQLGAIMATPGEFSKRAFINGKMSIDQAEGVMDIINAESMMQAEQASNLLQGSLKKQIENYQDELTDMLADIEAKIDYPEYEYTESETNNLINRMKDLKSELENLVQTSNNGLKIKNGVIVAIVGAPNVGKSSSLNALTNSTKAIVTNIAGTTRDVLHETLDLGIPVTLIDTAGIRDENNVDKVEEIGINYSKQSIEQADLSIFVYDINQGIQEEDQMILNLLEGRKHLVIANKTDLANKKDENVFNLSAETREGLDELREAIKNIVCEISPENLDYVTNTRQTSCLQRAKQALERALVASKEEQIQDLISIDVKDALLSLDEVTGEVITDDILNNIFEHFCIGK